MSSKGKIPEELREEAETLSELGVVDSDIEYLIKTKLKKNG